MTKEEFKQKMEEIEDKFNNDIYDEEKAHYRYLRHCGASFQNQNQTGGDEGCEDAGAVL